MWPGHYKAWGSNVALWLCLIGQWHFLDNMKMSRHDTCNTPALISFLRGVLFYFIFRVKTLCMWYRLASRVNRYNPTHLMKIIQFNQFFLVISKFCKSKSPFEDWSSPRNPDLSSGALETLTVHHVEKSLIMEC